MLLLSYYKGFGFWVIGFRGMVGGGVGLVCVGYAGLIGLGVGGLSLLPEGGAFLRTASLAGRLTLRPVGASEKVAGGQLSLAGRLLARLGRIPGMGAAQIASLLRWLGTGLVGLGLRRTGLDGLAGELGLSTVSKVQGTELPFSNTCVLALGSSLGGSTAAALSSSSFLLVLHHGSRHSSSVLLDFFYTTTAGCIISFSYFSYQFSKIIIYKRLNNIIRIRCIIYIEIGWIIIR